MPPHTKFAQDYISKQQLPESCKNKQFVVMNHYCDKNGMAPSPTVLDTSLASPYATLWNYASDNAAEWTLNREALPATIPFPFLARTYVCYGSKAVEMDLALMSRYIEVAHEYIAETRLHQSHLWRSQSCQDPLGPIAVRRRVGWPFMYHISRN